MKKLLLLLFLAVAGTGIAQVKLSDDPSVLILEAEQLMNQYSDGNSMATMRLDKALKASPNNEKANYLRAKAFMSARSYRHADESITKAIAVNPLNLEYRWIRVSCNITSHSSIDDFKKAIDDLRYINSIEPSNAKAYANISIAESNIAEYWQYKDSSQENKIKALQHYRLALESAKKAISLDDKYEDLINAKSLEQSIVETTN
ncbi:MAG: hypothetical protein V7767_05185 [Leeuwenhoekiella sp.]